tara:strand:- start:648 stop:2573 length:1926 start_codon:yes stop_codon:yes gene_type:complete
MVRLATQAEVSNPHRKGYDFRIDNQLYRAAVNSELQMTIQSSDVDTQDINLQQNPEDFTRNQGRIYSRNNFSGGSNLDMAHLRGGSPTDTQRFWDSNGIDVFTQNKGDRYSLSLLNSTAKVQSLSSSDGDNYLAVVGTTIYVSDDATLYQSTDAGLNWSTVSLGLTAGYHIKGLAAHGTTLYIVANNGSAGEIETWDGSTSTQKATTGAFDGIWSVKGKFLVSIGTSLREYDGATTVSSAIATLPTGETWTDAADVGAVVLASSSDGRIHSIKDVSSSFVLKGQTVLSHEEPVSVIEIQGQIFYGTTENTTTAKKIGRLYRAQLVVADDLYVLANASLIKEWNIDGVDATPYKLFATRDSLYTGIKETDSSYLYRYYLPTAGIARDLKFGTTGIVKGIGIVNEKLQATVQEQGTYYQTSNFVTTGYIITAAADFFTAERKQWVEAQIETEELSNSSTVELHVSDSIESLSSSTHTSWDKVIDIQSGVGTHIAQVDNKISRYGVIKLVMNSTGVTNTPRVNAISYRALARPELVVVQIPVNLSDRVERPMRKPFTVKNLGETIYKQLKKKEGTPVTLEIYEPSEVIRGVVEQIAYPISGINQVGSVTQYAIITIRGTRQEVYGTVTSGNAFGINALGVMRFG